MKEKTKLKKIDVYIKILQKRQKEKGKRNKIKKEKKIEKKKDLVFAIKACKSFLVEFHTP